MTYQGLDVRWDWMIGGQQQGRDTKLLGIMTLASVSTGHFTRKMQELFFPVRSVRLSNNLVTFVVGILFNSEIILDFMHCPKKTERLIINIDKNTFPGKVTSVSFVLGRCCRKTSYPNGEASGANQDPWPHLCILSA